MTDKEQIMINGVDVSGCISFDKNNEYNICCYDDIREDKIPFANFCVENKNCYYKQLKRKEQECEELLKENQQLRNSLSDSLMFKFTGQENETNRYRKALEEIEAATKINCEEICGRKFENCNDTSCFSVNILDIINKAKDGN